MNILVVLNYNDSVTTIDFIKRTSEIDIIDKIIVVDNYSSDDSFVKLKEYASQKIDVIQTMNNGGYSSGNNFGILYGIKKYSPDHIFVSNPDVFFSEKTLYNMIQKSNSFDDYGVLTCKMKIESGSILPIASKQLSFFDCVLENFVILSKLMLLSFNNGYTNLNNASFSKVDVIPGSFFLINPKAYKEINGFDENVFLYYEENILSLNLKEKGYSSYIILDDSYLHAHSVSIDKNISSVKKKMDLAFKSRSYYCQSYLKAGKVKMSILKISYALGLFDYLLAKKVISFLKNKSIYSILPRIFK